MATTDSFSEKADDAQEQIAHLRRQVEQLLSERVTPALADAAQRLETTARNATEFARGQAEAVSGQVREQPLISILIAAGIGYLIGRFASP
jgi:ElaB/YqjD/DUF883 family membrane-anchored ribosome-binding protein